MADNGSRDTKNSDNTDKKGHRDLYHYVFTIGGAIIAGVVNFVFLYPVHFLFSFIVLGITLSLLAIYQLRQFEFSTKQIIRSVAAIMILSVLLAAIIGPSHLPDVETVGLLVPGNGNAPNGCDGRKEVPPDSTIVVVGTNGYYSPPDATKFEPIVIRSCVPLTIFKKDKGLSIEAGIYFSEGKLIGSVTNNEFRAIVGDTSYAERNGELSSLSIFERKVWMFLWPYSTKIFNVKYVNDHTISTNGIFSCNGQNPITIADDGTIDANGYIHFDFQHSCFGASTSNNIFMFR